MSEPAGMDYSWMIEAAGTDPRRLAQLSLLLAGNAATIVQTLEPGEALAEILQMRSAMNEIAIRMGVEKELGQAIKDVWGPHGNS